MRSKNLAKHTSPRDSFYSCPDLSSLQISIDDPQNGATLDTVNGYDGHIITEPSSRAPSPDGSNPSHRPHRLGSTRRTVSKRARGVLGKVRAFHKVAAAKMAHPTIKIDTSVQATKRGLPEDKDEVVDVLGEQANPGLDEGDKEDVPPFLCQSVIGWSSTLIPWCHMVC